MLRKYLILLPLISLSHFSYTSEKITDKTNPRKRKAENQTVIISPAEPAIIISALQVVENIRSKPYKSYYNSQRSRNI